MKKLVVILDNGHGENTKGKCSPDKRLYEWEWTREIACRLHNLLIENEIEVQLLVPEDKDISLTERVKREKKITKETKNTYSCYKSSIWTYGKTIKRAILMRDIM